MEWIRDYQLYLKLKKIIKIANFVNVNPKQITFYRSYGSSARAYARIWGLPRIWQQALNIKPHYIIEVISEKFDKLSEYDKIKTLIHELLHIPKNFSGSLVPHKGVRNYNVNQKIVERIFNEYKVGENI
jgi:predicted metallopeptidase